MKYRPLDDNGDMLPVSTKDQMKSGVHAVAQAVLTRLQFFKGEWWEDQDVGMDIPTYLFKSLRVSEMDLIARYVSTYINETPGVNRLTDIQYSYDKHSMHFKCFVFANGEGETVEVNLDGIL